MDGVRPRVKGGWTRKGGRDKDRGGEEQGRG